MTFRVHSLALALAILGCSAESRGAEGPIAARTESRPVSGFSSIVADGFASVTVTVGRPHAVTVSCEDDANVQRVETRVDAEMLVVKSEPKRNVIFGNTKCSVEVSLPTIAAVEQRGSGPVTVRGRAVGLARVAMRGSGDVDVETAEAERFELTLAGSGAFRLRTLATKKTTVDATGSGRAVLSGKTESVDVKSLGSGAVDTRALAAEQCHLELRGSGGAHVHASKRADVDVAGSGSATVFGNPAERTKSVRGSGSVTFES